MEKENLKFKLNQKRDRAAKTAKEIQEEQHKIRKVGDALKGTIDSLSVKKKQMAAAQYKVCKTDINCQDQLKRLQSQLVTCQKEMKDKKNRVKNLEVSLSQHQFDLDKKFEEIRELKSQAHKNLGSTKLLDQEVTQWERKSRHLQILLDQKEAFLQDLLDGPNQTLLRNLVKDAQYWNDRHARLTQFSVHALEDLPKLLEDAYDVIFPHDTPCFVFHFVFVCRVVFKRLQVDHVVAH